MLVDIVRYRCLYCAFYLYTYSRYPVKSTCHYFKAIHNGGSCMFAWVKQWICGDSHGKTKLLEEKLADMQTKIDALLAGQQKADDALHRLSKTLKEWQAATFYNQIALADNKPGMFTLYTPWSSHSPKSGQLRLERLPNGQFCFVPPPEGSESKYAVNAITLPKSGTFFLDAILAKLGFQSINIIKLINDTIEDNRDGAKTVHTMPFDLLTELVMPGQFCIGHGFGQQIVDARLNNKLLLTIRDLRHMLVSWVRYTTSSVKSHSEPIPSLSTISPEYIISFLGEWPGRINAVKLAAKTAAELVQRDKAHIVRFEELSSTDPDIMRPAVQAIALATGYDAERVRAAIDDVRQTPTATYSGKYTTIDGLWTQELETYFIENGWDVLNEQLGYPREYVATYYKR